MVDYTKKSYYNFLPENTKKLLASISRSETDNTKDLAQQQFVQSYQPQTSFWSKIGSDIKTFSSSLPKIIPTLWDMHKKDLEKTGNYDTSKPFWKQGEGYNIFTNQESRDLYKKNIGLQALTSLVPGYKFLETIAHAPYIENTKFGKAIPKTPISSFANSAILNSLMKNTGKWIYNPEAEGRRWFQSPSEENSRWQEFKEHPFLTGLEDLTNVAIVGAPFAKAFGRAIGAAKPYTNISEPVLKLAGVPSTTRNLTGLAASLKFLEESRLGQTATQVGSTIGKVKNYIPNKATEFLGNQLAKFRLQQEFKSLISQYERNHFLGKENILQPGYAKLTKMGAELPLEAQQHLFKVLEGTAKYDENIINKAYLAAKESGVTSLRYDEFKSSFDTALDYIKTKSIKETNYLVKKGILTVEEADKRAWMPAVKQHLVKTGRYTMQELDDILNKENGWGKTLSDEFDLSVAEMEKLGYKKPVYMPHQFDQYINNSEFFTQQPIYKKTPSFLKKTKGVEGYIEEPYMVWTRYELQSLKWKLTDKLVNKIVDKFGLPLKEGEALATGYKKYYPEGFLKNMFTKNPQLKTSTMVQLPDFMVNELNRMFNAPGQFEKFLRATYDPVTKVWKTSVLALSPRWIFNNFIGNIVLNTLGAVTDPMAYINSFKKLRQASKIVKETGVSETRAMSKLGIRSGVVDTGVYAGSAREAARGLARVAETSPIQSMFGKALNYTGLPQIVKGMYRLNRTIENFYRVAHYLDKIGKGFSPSKALASVNEFLFDYSALSSVEKSVARRILPFYAWQKNITRLALTYPFKNPTRTWLLTKANLLTKDNKNEGMDFRFLPDYLQGYIDTGVTNKEGENYFFSTRGINPLADIMPSLSSINPILKIILERMTKQNLYTGKDFSSPYQNVENGQNQKALPSLWRHIASQFPQFTTIENIIKPYARYDTGEPILVKEPKTKKALAELQAKGIKVGDYKYEKEPLLTLLKLLGISLTPLNIEEMTQTGIENAMKAETQRQNYDKTYQQNFFNKLESSKGGI